MVSRLLVISKRSDFSHLKAQGKKLRIGPWLLIVSAKNEMQTPRFAWTISSKVASAVTRNKLKRWFRVVCRRKLQDGFNLPYDFNFIIKPVNDEFYKKIKFREFNEILDQAFKKIN